MRLVLIDREPMFGIGLAHVLSRSSPADELRAYTSVTAWLQQHHRGSAKIDAVMVDAHVLDADGPSALAPIAQRLPTAVRVVIARSLAETSQSMLAPTGAAGVIHRALPADDFVTRLRELVQAHGGQAGSMNGDAARRQSITPRQHEVLSLIALGEPNKRIADALSIAERTVKLHVTALLDSLGARNRTQAVIKAQQRGLLMQLPDASRAPETRRLHRSTIHNAGPVS
jgi:DNA-binding NarL/FixJ family response regulator